MAKKSSVLLFLAIVLLTFAVISIAYRGYQRTAEANAVRDGLREQAIGRQSDELTFASQRRNIGLDIENRQTEDRIAELEGGPRTNIVSIAVLEGKLESDDLYKSIEYETAQRLELLARTSPDGWNVLHTPLEHCLEAVIELRRANLGNDENAKNAAELVFKTRFKRAQIIAEEYEKALQAAAPQNGK